MKLTELFVEHKLKVQLIWGEQKIEFDSEVRGVDEKSTYISAYNHNGSPLELNITPGKGAVCNLFTDDPQSGKRISWKNVELTTEKINDETLYRVKTFSFNANSDHDDRRQHDRIVIQAKAKAFDSKVSDGDEVLVHDISDVGVSFYAPLGYTPMTNQVTITFTDNIENKTFNAKVECLITRSTTKAGNKFFGCKIISTNKDYQLYGFMKRLIKKAL